jgi:hypothetical protein
LKVTLVKLGVLAAIATALVLFATMRPGMDTPTAQADFGTPGGISALPSASPAIPGVANQGIPAIIPARGDGSNGLVTVFCDPDGDLPFHTGPCGGWALIGSPPRPFWDWDDEWEGGIVTFVMTQKYGDGSLASSFDASGSDTLVCKDGAACDLAGYSERSGSPDGVVAVLVHGGGENEILSITATDDVGEARTVEMVVVDTMLAWGEGGAISTASQESPAFISYACPSIGTRGLTALDQYADPDEDGKAGLDDIFDLLYGEGMDLSALYNKLGPRHEPDVDIQLLQCGGDTGSLFDDFVDFQTDKGIFSVDPAAVLIEQSIFDLMAAFGVLTPPTLDFDCGEGKNIDTFDINSLAVWGAIFVTEGSNWSEGGCDVDFAGNGVVTTMLLGNGEVGVATIRAQQGGGVSPPRTINVTFVGEAAMSLFITAPESIGLTGGDFTVGVVDQDGRPVGGETVECTVDPTGGALAILDQTGTTAPVTDTENYGTVPFTLIPTGKSVLAGEELTITCVLDSDRSVSATAKVALSTTPELESVALVVGCNPVAMTRADGTAIETVAGAVAPADALEAIWKFDPATGTWKGYSPSAPPAVNDLVSVDRLDAGFVCVNAAATLSRPVI